MMRTSSLWTVLGAAILLLACSEKEEEQVVTIPMVHSVSVTETSLVIPSGGSVVLPFSVEDKKATLGEVKLLLSGGQEPISFRVKEVTPGPETGSYQAVIEDAGLGDEYDLEVHLAVFQRNATNGKEYYVPSATIRIQSEYIPPELKTGLPVVYVDTEGGKPVVSKEDYLNASLSIRGTEVYEGLESAVCQIRGRGNTTWTWPKKPYLLKLDSKQSIFGFPKHKRWILLANFLDRTLMRNLVSMKVSSMTNLAWTPHCVPVELVLNGKHQGSYLLIEQVRVDKNRVNITEMKPEDNAGDKLTGGYLLELDFHYDNKVQWIDPHGRNNQWGDGIPFGVKSPDEDEITPEQVAYIKQYVYDAAEALYGPDFKDPEKGYAKYIDVDSFIDYWIVFEVMGNHELSNPGSVYMHKDRGGKLVAGPCWDFDWGVLSYNTSPQARSGLINGNAIWYARLRQDPAFEAKLKARFQELLPQLETIPAYMDECEKLLTASAKLNFAMWNPAEDASQNGGHIINGDENLSFHDAVTRLKSIFQDRLKVIPAKL